MHWTVIPHSRLAVVGCAYGNLPAFTACCDDAAAQGCGAVLGAGDYLGFCGHGDEMLALVRTRLAAAVAGNHELAVAAGAAVCGCGHADPAQERLSCAAAAPQADGIDEAGRAWLAALPHPLAVATPGGALLLCHGSPAVVNAFLHRESLDAQQAGRWLAGAGCAALACSHTGLAWTAPLPAGRLAVNCGSAGRPDDHGDPAVHYAIIDLGGAEPRAEIRRVAYDHTAWAAQLRREGREERFVAQLVDGRWARPAPARALRSTACC